MARRRLEYGYRGCCGKTKRRGRERLCAQRPIIVDSEGGAWCYYHNPLDPKKFGEGYGNRRETTNG